jgi:ABC-type multidrug transport system ATPase subunit
MQTQEGEYSNIQTITDDNLRDDGDAKARSEIVINGLVKGFGDVVAVNGLNLDIRKGEFFGFLGPNGAGKTTTISILCGLLAPTAGSVHIGGFDIRKDMPRIKERMGVCPQESVAFKFLTGMENMNSLGNFMGWINAP